MLKRRKGPRQKISQERGTRQCCACRLRAPRESLMRFVIDSDQLAWLDPHLKAPGRGAHLCYTKSCVDIAWKKKSFSASFKAAVKLPSQEEFLKIFIESQQQKIANLIGLARRRGEMISGLNMLEHPSHKVHFLVLASDISEQSRTSLIATLCQEEGVGFAQAPFFPEGNPLAIFSEKDLSLYIDSLASRWSGSALGSLIGKAHRVALGVTSNEISEQLTLEIMRISQVLVASST